MQAHKSKPHVTDEMEESDTSFFIQSDEGGKKKTD